MKKLRDFKCDNCTNVFEVIVYDAVVVRECPECNKFAYRMPSAPKVAGNTTGGSPSFSKNKY